MNIERDDKFQDAAMGEIRLALEAFRPDREAELPGPGDEPLLDALMHLTRELDASPETVNAACARVIEMAGAASAATTETPAASAR